jgi:hypothetical protein
MIRAVFRNRRFRNIANEDSKNFELKVQVPRSGFRIQGSPFPDQVSAFQLNEKRLSAMRFKRLRCASDSFLRHSAVRYSIFCGSSSFFIEVS